MIEASLTYEPAAGVIEVVANAKETRQAFVRFFAESLLGVELGSDRLPLRRYDLAVLRRQYHFPTDPKDGIENVRVTCLRLMPFDTAGERVTLECESASKVDPRRFLRKSLNDREFLEKKWGHGWTPIKFTQTLQIGQYVSCLEPERSGVRVQRRFTDTVANAHFQEYVKRDLSAGLILGREDIGEMVGRVREVIGRKR